MIPSAGAKRSPNSSYHLMRQFNVLRTVRHLFGGDLLPFVEERRMRSPSEAQR